MRLSSYAIVIKTISHSIRYKSEISNMLAISSPVASLYSASVCNKRSASISLSNSMFSKDLRNTRLIAIPVPIPKVNTIIK